jgi:hypothetical protein
MIIAQFDPNTQTLGLVCESPIWKDTVAYVMVSPDEYRVKEWAKEVSIDFEEMVGETMDTSEGKILLRFAAGSVFELPDNVFAGLVVINPCEVMEGVTGDLMSRILTFMIGEAIEASDEGKKLLKYPVYEQHYKQYLKIMERVKEGKSADCLVAGTTAAVENGE